MLLSNPQLQIDKAYINGKWQEAASGHSFDVYNPATQALIATLPNMGEIDTVEAILAAHKAFEVWRTTSATERANLLRKWYDLMRLHEKDLAVILTSEQGKPLAEALGEIQYGASYIEWFAEEARRIYGDIIPAQQNDKRIMVIKQPVGVVGIITPWNFPNAMIARKVGAALAAGCTVVIKPSELTPLSALAMTYLAEEAGIPAGVINVITGTNAAEIGGELTRNPLVRKISFTGSTAVGKLLIRQCAETVKKITMELGGNAPFIVFDDADIESAVRGLMMAKFRNGGQTCIAANRIYVQNNVYERFVTQFSMQMAHLKVGNGMENRAVIGPLINEKALAKAEMLVEDALSKGANLLLGGKRHELGGTFYEPTLLTDVTPEMLLSEVEIFAPIAALYRFDTEDEVIQLANNTDSGLAAYFYGQNIHRVYRVAEALQAGMVGINTGLISTAVAPFGGIKESGFGREGSKYGLDDYLEMKYLCLGVA